MAGIPLFCTEPVMPWCGGPVVWQLPHSFCRSGLQTGRGIHQPASVVFVTYRCCRAATAQKLSIASDCVHFLSSFHFLPLVDKNHLILTGTKAAASDEINVFTTPYLQLADFAPDGRIRERFLYIENLSRSIFKPQSDFAQEISYAK